MRRLSLAMPFVLLCLWSASALTAAQELAPLPPQPAGTPYPTQAWPELPSDDPLTTKVSAVLAHAFDGERPVSLVRTRALLVVQGGRIIAERYSDGITKDTRLQSWSMSKSFLHAAVGIAIADGKIDPAAPAPVPEWRDKSDPRHVITIRQLAQMTSGLEFTESYSDPSGEAMQMLFGAGRGDVGHAAANLASVHAPGTYWFYSSGSANIISRSLRDALGGRVQYRDFLRSRLFAPLGITSAVPEFDASGTWIGSSYVHATARDFARFGLLYLRGGMWDGKQILPRQWIDVARTPTLASKGAYGALFWLNAPDPDTGAPAIDAALPTDMFMARGFGGQFIAVVPSRDAIIVMLNVAYTGDTKPIIALVADVLKALP